MDWLEKIGLYSIPAFLLLITVEQIAYYLSRKENAPQGRSTGSMSPKDTAASLATYGIGYFAAPLGRFIDVPFLAIAAWLTPFALGGGWWLLLLALPLTDLAYYAEHRLSHRVRLFWAAHSVHHSSEHFNMSTALRLSWLIPGQFVQSLVYVPLVLIGMPLWIVFLSQTIVLLFQFPLHTEGIDRLPRFIEYVFNTPSHHRVHHGANNPYLDKNYGGILIIWDRMFGSYAEETERVRYGLTKNIGRNDPITVNFHEFGRMLRDIWRARTWRGRVGYLLRPPGWTEPEAHVDDRNKAMREQFSTL